MPDARELPEPTPAELLPPGLRARPVPGHHHPQGPGHDRAPYRGWHHDHLAVNSDRNLRAPGYDGDFLGFQHPEAAATSAPDEAHGLRGVVDGNGDHAECAAREPCAT